MKSRSLSPYERRARRANRQLIALCIVAPCALVLEIVLLWFLLK